MDTANIESVSPLTAMQKGMYFSYAVDEKTTAYVEQFDFTFEGDIDPDALRQAVDATARHHAVLRTAFSFRNTDEPYQIILKERELPIDTIDLPLEVDVATAIADIRAAERRRSFHLADDPLLRVTLVNALTGPHHLIITFHHIILDGWSLGPLLGTLFGYLTDAMAGREVVASREAFPYRNYLTWLGQQDAADSRAYWEEALSDHERTALLPTTDTTDAEPEFHTHRVTLSAATTAALDETARTLRVTPSTVFQTAWGIVLQKYNHNDDVVFGTVVSGRSIQLDGIEEMVGLFVNTQPVRVQSHRGATFAEVARSVQQAAIAATPHAHHPLYEIQAAGGASGDLIDHVVAFENYPIINRLPADPADPVRFVDVDVHEETNYDLHIVVNPGDCLAVQFTHNAHRLPTAVVEQLSQSLGAVVAQITADPQVVVDDIALCEATPTADDLPALPDGGVTARFAAMVAEYPDATAAIWGDERLTYAELDSRAAQLAGHLDTLVTEPGQAIGVLMDRRPELLVAMLAIVRLGHVIVPLDIKDPLERLQSTIADAGARVMCTVADLAVDLPGCSHVLVDEPPVGDPAPVRPVSNDTVATLMYTSGSTGQPKGCRITHRALLRLVLDQTYHRFGPEQVLLSTSSPAFDALSFEVWGTLLWGGTIVLTDDMDILDTGRMKALIVEHGVTAFWLTAGLFSQHADRDPGLFAVDQVISGGAAMSVPHARMVLDACPQVALSNGYGPTENTTFSAVHRVQPADLDRPRIPIGRAITRTSCHVVDAGLNPLPPGAIGELCFGGDGVGLGYLHREELTAERFVTSRHFPGRLYRSGDLVRQLPDGTLDFLGRVDEQVKINGFRVEPGEVEATLRTVSGVESAVVTATTIDSRTQLEAWYIGRDGVATVRTALTDLLPTYLIPAQLWRVDEIPLNRNAKVDFARLRAMTEQAPSQPTPATTAPPPAEGVEQQLHDIVADVLGTSPVDLHTNFFDLGINSLTLLTVNNRIRKELDVDLPVTDLFEHTTVATLAHHLERLSTSDDDADVETPFTPVDLSPVDEDDEEELALATGRMLRQLTTEGL